MVGLAIIFAELRTRWTTTRTIKVVVFLGSWLGRGIFYILAALLNLPITVEVYNIQLAQGKEFAGLVGLAGVLSLIMYVFVFKLERKREMARQTWLAEQILKGELEEITVDLNNGHTMFDPTLAKLAPEA